VGCGGQVTVSFVIAGKVVSINAGYVRAKFASKRGAGGGKGLVLSGAAREFKNRVRHAGRIARDRSAWPHDLFEVEAVRLTIRMWNSRHDPGAGDKFIRDALEGVFYRDDRIVSMGPGDRPTSDKLGARVEIDVELLERVSPAIARHNRVREEARLAKKLTHVSSKQLEFV
jgi:hypothetical protein